MRTIIISDINSEVESIIPYGLNFAKFLETEVDILHTFDSRSVQNIYSSYSDSQSITPGNKLSPEEMIEREKHTSEIELKRILSAEASRLNYPLKINTLIEETDIESKLKSIHGRDYELIVLINTHTRNTNFDSLNEIISTVESTNAIYLFVHPGQVFHEFDRVILPTDFTAEDLHKYPHISYLFKDHKPIINAVNVTKSKEYVSIEMKSAQWKKGAKNVFTESTVNSTVLTGKKYNETLIRYLLKDKPDLVLLFKREKSLLKRLFDKDLLKQLLEQTEIPVLFYSSD